MPDRTEFRKSLILGILRRLTENHEVTIVRDFAVSRREFSQIGVNRLQGNPARSEDGRCALLMAVSGREGSYRTPDRQVGHCGDQSNDRFALAFEGPF